MDTTFARQAKLFFAEPRSHPFDHFDQPPADFDTAAHPIIAEHWYGIEPPRPIGGVYPRKHASARRASGPGEIARSRELRRRGLHLRLIEAWRP